MVQVLKKDGAMDEAVKGYYLEVPVSENAEMQFLDIFINGVKYDRLQLKLSQEPQMWASIYLNVSTEDCVQIELEEKEMENLMEDVFCLKKEKRGAKNLYKEVLRPLVHFSPSQGYMNDPNGLYYYDGLYHMFFQWNPYGLSHGNTHWGAAVSRDLLHWQEQGAAIVPDDMNGNIFSGSGIVDYENCSGLQEGEYPPILLFYTATGKRYQEKTSMPQKPPLKRLEKFKQAMAYSVDGGRTFRKYEKNPILDEIDSGNRDPKVIWNEDTQSFIMVLYLRDRDNEFVLLHSQNLLDWELSQRITLPDSAECPDLFPLYLDEHSDLRKWILFASPENYMVGHFLGKKFVAETSLMKGTMQVEGIKSRIFNRAAYAAQTFFGARDNRIIQLSWIPTTFPGMQFQSCMSIPWEIKLVTTSEGMRLKKYPVAELDSLHGNHVEAEDTDAFVLNDSLNTLKAEAMDVQIVCHLAKDSRFAISVRGVLLVYDHARKELYFPTGKYKQPLETDLLDIRMIVDRGSVEVFTCGGLFQCVLNACPDVSRREVEILELSKTKMKVSCFELVRCMISEQEFMKKKEEEYGR